MHLDMNFDEISDLELRFEMTFGWIIESSMKNSWHMVHLDLHHASWDDFELMHYQL